MTKRQCCGLAGVCLLAVWAAFIPAAAKGESTTDAAYEQEGAAGETTGARYAAPLGLPVVLDNAGGAGISVGVKVQPATGSSSSGKRQSGGKRLVPAASFADDFPDRSPGSGDPGIGSGLWVPAGYPNLFVVDQSGTGITTSYVPGCLNGANPGSSSWRGCAANNSFTANNVTIEMVKGKVLSVRYKSKSTAGTSKKYFILSGFDGGPTGPVYVWLTDDPRKTYGATDDKCKSYSTIGPGVLTGPTYCQIYPNKTYYLNIESDMTTRSQFKIFEDAADFLY